jgi:sugar phosphate isomerase/epimerase
MKKIPIGLELYSVRNEFARDPAGTLQAVKAMGYDCVEFAGASALSGPALRRLLDENGLVCCGWHTPYAAVLPDTLAATIDLNREVGNRFVVVPGLPAEKTRTRADWLAMAGFFSDLAAKLADEGLFVGYHNHTREFKPIGGEAPWDTLFGNTDRRVVAQLDTGNALCGGGDCAVLLARYPGQGITVHLKPYHTTPPGTDAGFRPLIGDDSVPWAEVFRLCETVAGTQWYIVEYESDAHPPLKAVELTLQRLRAMGR